MQINDSLNLSLDLCVAVIGQLLKAKPRNFENLVIIPFNPNLTSMILETKLTFFREIFLIFLKSQNIVEAYEQ